uniref:Sfi1 domain-containing protein n=1 Tax=Biomphalaria glabrata TaxID=6526 RepID=A0A2C9LG12_BIOGL
KKVTMHQKAYEYKTIKSSFTKWWNLYTSRKEAENAKRIFSEACARKFFKLWLKTWQDNIAYRCHIDQIMSHKKLHRSLLTWRQNVVTLKKRQKLAVELIENCHMRQTFNSWRCLTSAKRNLRYHFMKNVFHSWQGVTQIFKSERSVDMATSIEHWRAQRLHHSFFHWYEQLRIKRAEKMANYSLSNKQHESTLQDRMFHIMISTYRTIQKTKAHFRSYNFYVVNLLSSHFNYWKERAMFCIKTRKADAVFRRHMLAKGFKALQWSVSQSMHLLQKLQTKYHSGLLQETFTKWKTKAMMQRRERIQNSFERWKQFVQETLKVRYMQGVSQRNKLIEVLRCWKKLFIKHQKINKASRYFRVKVLKHTMKCWKEFVYKYKVKKEKHQLA